MDGEKIALVLDEPTGKILGYKTQGLHDWDTQTDASAVELIRRAEYEDKDAYFTNDGIEVRERDPDEYGNKLNLINAELLQVKDEIKRFMSAAEKPPDAAKEIRSLIRRERALEREAEKAEAAHDRAMYRYKKRQLKTTDFKYYCSICLIIRDENEYLKEWLDWHIGQGVEHFYIYDHGSKQPVSEFIKTLDAETSQKITVQWFGGAHKFAQHDAYNDCLKRYGKQSRWIGFIDADEMIRVKCGMTLPELLKYYEDFAGLFMRWIEYDANGMVKKTNEPLRKRFTRVSPADVDDGIGKSFMQALLVRRMHTHNGLIYPGFKVADENMSTFTEAEIRKRDSTADIVCVDHYYTKSYEEWLEKLRRGTCDPVYSRKYADFFIYNPDMEYCRENVYVEQKYEVSEKTAAE